MVFEGFFKIECKDTKKIPHMQIYAGVFCQKLPKMIQKWRSTVALMILERLFGGNAV